jgi:hypothetical protein
LLIARIARANIFPNEGKVAGIGLGNGANKRLIAKK